MTPISSLAEMTGTVERAGDALGGAVAGAGLAGRHGRIGDEVDVGPGDAAAVGRDDDRAVHLRQLGQPLRAVRRVDEEAAGADRQHVGLVVEHEQGAGLGPHDAVDAVAQRRPRRHPGERVAHLLVGTAVPDRHVGRLLGATLAHPWRHGVVRQSGQRQRLATACARGPSECRRHRRGRARHDRPREPEPRRLGQPAPGVGDLAQLAAEPDLAEHDEIGGHRPARERRWRRRGTPRGRAPGSTSRTPPTVEA